MRSKTGGLTGQFWQDYLFKVTLHLFGFCALLPFQLSLQSICDISAWQAGCGRVVDSCLVVIAYCAIGVCVQVQLGKVGPADEIIDVPAGSLDKDKYRTVLQWHPIFVVNLHLWWGPVVLAIQLQQFPSSILSQQRPKKSSDSSLRYCQGHVRFHWSEEACCVWWFWYCYIWGWQCKLLWQPDWQYCGSTPSHLSLESMWRKILLHSFVTDVAYYNNINGLAIVTGFNNAFNYVSCEYKQDQSSAGSLHQGLQRTPWRLCLAYFWIHIQMILTLTWQTHAANVLRLVKMEALYTWGKALTVILFTVGTDMISIPLHGSLRTNLVIPTIGPFIVCCLH